MATATTSYDRVPYRSFAFPQTHPDRLAAMARIFGVVVPDVARCRVLELGCASGGNLIPMAFNLPDSQFVGVDLSRYQVAEARATTAALDLRNVRVEHVSLMDIDASWGEFDYIICHGVFSWVEEPVQDRILQIARDHLSPTGVAYISYNTYPGWHMREMVRDMMLYHTRQFGEPQEQIEQARALLAFLTSAAEGSGPYGELLAREIERLSRANDAYLFHEHLEQTNTPMYFHQFIERADRAGLVYLSEASIGDMLTSGLPPAVAETLDRISPDILHLEQYLDFVRNRQFRQTLLCRRGVQPMRRLSYECLSGLLVSSRAMPESTPVDLAPGVTATFWNGEQRADAVFPASKAAYAALAERWPEAIPADDLCVEGVERAAVHLGDTTPAAASAAVLADLFGGVIHGMLRLHTQPPPCACSLAAAPRAHPLSAFQARHGTVVVNAHHENIRLEAFDHAVLLLCDGRHDRGTMAEALAARVRSGELMPPDGDAGMESGGADLAERVARGLDVLRRHALLVG